MILNVALDLLPVFEMGSLKPPAGATPLDELPSFEQRQAVQMGLAPQPAAEEEAAKRTSSFGKLGKLGGGKKDESKRSSEQEELACSICLTGYADDKTCTMLPCGHIFHRECISGWLQSGRTAGGDCPMCKEPILQARCLPPPSHLLHDRRHCLYDRRPHPPPSPPPPLHQPHPPPA